MYASRLASPRIDILPQLLFRVMVEAEAEVLSGSVKMW